mmetsp:Transcript_17804/g.50462  ORF Transcript_17804/g.50462 Transcript_17804/m.50462 type:complete len:251 (-) Transcript_17804:1200-1952(-)
MHPLLLGQCWQWASTCARHHDACWMTSMPTSSGVLCPCASSSFPSWKTIWTGPGTLQWPTGIFPRRFHLGIHRCYCQLRCRPCLRSLLRLAPVLRDYLSSCSDWKPWIQQQNSMLRLIGCFCLGVVELRPSSTFPPDCCSIRHAMLEYRHRNCRPHNPGRRVGVGSWQRVRVVGRLYGHLTPKCHGIEGAAVHDRHHHHRRCSLLTFVSKLSLMPQSLCILKNNRDTSQLGRNLLHHYRRGKECVEVEFP